MKPEPSRRRRPAGAFAFGSTAAVCVVAACNPGAAQSGGDGAPFDQLTSGAVAFENVRVLPMDEERVLDDHTVVVQGDSIAWMGPTDDARLPEGVRLIDGRGRTLMPGLAEMHAHVPGDNTPRQLMDDVLFLYVANGITTIRGMLGAPGQLQIREELRSGQVIGPRMIVGAPSINGNSAPEPRVAEQLVRSYKEQGYDFLKIHPGVPLDAWDRMVEVAREVGITYAGHVPEDVGIEHALRTGIQTVDHLDGYFQDAISDALRQRLAGDLGVVPTADVVAGIDWERVDELVRITVDEGVWNVPTLYLWENFYAPVDADSMIAQPEMQYVPARMREGWAAAKKRRGSESVEVARSVADARTTLLRKLNEAGAGILMGTDSPQMFNVPGFALHHELVIMGRVMPAWDVLASGTRNVATYVGSSLGLDNRFGTVVVGNRADLILVEGDPLTDLGRLGDLAGVMVAGRWLSGEEIRDGLAAIEGRYGG